MKNLAKNATAVGIVNADGMKIAICASMAFAKEMLGTKKLLEQRGHTVFVSDYAEEFIGKTEVEKQLMNEKNFRERDVIRSHWKNIQKSDAILVLNYDRKGITNYIGGNTLMEIGFAHVLYKEIFLLNPIPDIPLYKAEIEGIEPIVLNGDLSKI